MQQNVVWQAISCRNVMDNMFSRDIIKGLVFNSFDGSEQITFTKGRLLGIMELIVELPGVINGEKPIS